MSTAVRSMNVLCYTQAYVNSTGDVQTAALITSRCDTALLVPSYAAQPATTTTNASSSITVEWLHTYRDLLNHWQVSVAYL
jgi:hypothetical protein